MYVKGGMLRAKNRAALKGWAEQKNLWKEAEKQGFVICSVWLRKPFFCVRPLVACTKPEAAPLLNSEPDLPASKPNQAECCESQHDTGLMLNLSQFVQKHLSAAEHAEALMKSISFPGILRNNHTVAHHVSSLCRDTHKHAAQDILVLILKAVHLHVSRCSVRTTPDKH